MLGPGVLFLPALGIKLMPEWTAFCWAIGVLLSAHVVLEFFRLVRWVPRAKARVLDVILRALGLGIGVLLLMKGPNYVTTLNPDVTRWANLNFETCIAVWVAISVWRAGGIIWLLRDRHQMLPARQHRTFPASSGFTYGRRFPLFLGPVRGSPWRGSCSGRRTRGPSCCRLGGF